jgi:hypothetical protein
MSYKRKFFYFMASSKDNIRLGGFKAYYGTQYLGQTGQDGLTFNRNGNRYDVMTALAGEGVFKSFSTGEHAEIELELLEFDKDLLSKVLGAVNSFNTNPADGADGVITGGYSPGVELRPKPFFAYPTFVDANNQPLTADANNDFAIIMFAAVPNLENEIVVSPTEETKFPISFIGQYDVTRPEGQQVWAIGAVTAPTNSVPVITSV